MCCRYVFIHSFTHSGWLGVKKKVTWSLFIYSIISSVTCTVRGVRRSLARAAPAPPRCSPQPHPQHAHGRRASPAHQPGQEHTHGPGPGPQHEHAHQHGEQHQHGRLRPGSPATHAGSLLLVFPAPSTTSTLLCRRQRDLWLGQRRKQRPCFS